MSSIIETYGHLVDKWQEDKAIVCIDHKPDIVSDPCVEDKTIAKFAYNMVRLTFLESMKGNLVNICVKVNGTFIHLATKNSTGFYDLTYNTKNGLFSSDILPYDLCYDRAEHMGFACLINGRKDSTVLMGMMEYLLQCLDGNETMIGMMDFENHKPSGELRKHLKW